LSKSERTTD